MKVVCKVKEKFIRRMLTSGFKITTAKGTRREIYFDLIMT